MKPTKEEIEEAVNKSDWRYPFDKFWYDKGKEDGFAECQKQNSDFVKKILDYAKIRKYWDMITIIDNLAKEFNIKQVGEE